MFCSGFLATSYFSLWLDEVCLKFGPCFMSAYFFIPIITVILEQDCVEGYDVDCIDNVLIID